jgi:N-acetylglucosamine-6-sulfatase
MPTFLEAAGTKTSATVDGSSWLPLAQGRDVAWRDSMLYEYYWERNFPQTPTVHALREDRYKFIRYYGIWDVDELYDLENDPAEMQNLIYSQAHQQIAQRMRSQLFATLEKTQGMQIPLFPDRGGQQNRRTPSKSRAADFPEPIYRAPQPPPAQKKR